MNVLIPRGPRPIVINTRSIPQFLRLTQDERAWIEELGIARLGAKSEAVRNYRADYHRNISDGSIMDPYTHQLIDTSTKELRHLYSTCVGLAGQAAVTIGTGVPMEGDASGDVNDRGDQGGCIEDKTYTFDNLKKLDLKLKVTEYNSKGFIRWYNVMLSDKPYACIRFLGCISRQEFDEHREPFNYGHCDNWIVNVKWLMPYIATFENHTIMLYPIAAGDANNPVTSNETGYNLQQLTIR